MTGGRERRERRRWGMMETNKQERRPVPNTVRVRQRGSDVTGKGEREKGQKEGDGEGEIH